MPFPRLIVDPPAYHPLPYGLLASNVVDFRPDADVHWRGGVNWQDLCQPEGANTTFDECISAATGVGELPDPSPKTATGELVTFGATPFTVYAEVDCSAPGFWDESQRWGTEALSRSEEFAVELAFWTGIADGQSIVYPHLAANADVVDSEGITLQNAAITSTETALDVVEGLGRLEQALGICLGGRGIIHVPSILIPALQAQFLVNKVGSQLVTTNGNIVVAGSGYTGSAPDGTTTDGVAWIYGTGPIFGYRSGIHVNPPESTLDREINTVMAIAERTYVLGYSCCLVGIPLTTGGIISGAPNIA